MFDHMWPSRDLDGLDLLISKSNHFIFVTNCTEVVNLVKFPRAVYKMSDQTFSV